MNLVLKAYGRKVIIFLIALAVLVPCSFFLDVEIFDSLGSKVVLLAGAFFAGNGIEHIAGVFKK